MLMEVIVPGSCGQIAQGWRNGQPYLITCPVALYSRVLVMDGTSVKSGIGRKSRMALNNTCNYLGVDRFPYGMSLESQIPTGKGMGSSSADISAIIAATGAAIGEHLTPDEIGEIAAGIEPTDGVFYPGIANMNYMTGEVYKTYEYVPKMILAMFDTEPDGKVNSVDFHAHFDENRMPHDSSPELLAAIDSLDEKVSSKKLAEIAIMSARENQRLMPKDVYEDLLAYAQELGALGVCVAHTGTMVGVMWHPATSMKEVTKSVAKIKERFPKLAHLDTQRMVSGGYSVHKQN